MTDYLTRLLARTQGAIPTERLAQPLLQPTFAPDMIPVEQPVEVYAERNTLDVTSPVQERPAKARNNDVSHSVEKRVPFATSQITSIPSSFENQPYEPTEALRETDVELGVDQMIQPTQHTSTQPSLQPGRNRREGDRQEIVQRQSAYEPPARSGVEENNGISYSHYVVNPSDPSSSLLPGLQVSPLTSMQLAQDIPSRHEEHQAVQRQTGGKQFTGEGKPLVEEGIDEKLFTRERNSLSEQGIGDRERVRETEHPLLLEQDVSMETAHVNPSSQRTERTETTTQGTRHVDSKEASDIIAPFNAVESARATESTNLASVERESAFSARQERIVESEQLISPLLPGTMDTGNSELMSHEVSTYPGEEILRDEQQLVRDVVHQEQAERRDSPATRRLVPAQTYIAQPQEMMFHATEPVRTPSMPVTPPTIQVSIGRIEVRAITAPTPQPRAKPTRPSPSLSLEDYLKQQKGER